MVAKGGPNSLGPEHFRVRPDLVGARHLRLVRMASRRDRSPNALLSLMGAHHSRSWFRSECRVVDCYRLLDLKIQRLNVVGLLRTNNKLGGRIARHRSERAPTREGIVAVHSV